MDTPTTLLQSPQNPFATTGTDPNADLFNAARAAGTATLVGGASVAPSTPNTGVPKTVPVVTADDAIKDLSAKKSTFNQLQQGMAQQSQVNATNNANQQASDQQSQQMTNALDVEKAKTDALNNATSALTDGSSETTQTPAEKQAGFSYQDIQKQLDEATTAFNTSLSQLQGGSFPLTPAQQAQLNSTKQLYDNITGQIRSSYANTLSGVGVLNERLGLSQYAPKTALGNIQGVMDEMQTKITSNEATAAKAVGDLQAAFEKDDYTRINDAYDKLSASLDKKTTLLNTLNDQISKQATLALETHKSNMADIKQTQDRQQAVIDFAVKNNITKPAYLVGNTAFDSHTGEPLSFSDFLKMTGQDPNTPEDQADYSQLQSDIQTPEERTLAFNEQKQVQDQSNADRTFNQNESHFQQTQALEYAKLATKTGLPDGSSLGDYTEETSNGNKYVNYDKLTPAEKAAVGSIARQNGIPLLKAADVGKLNAIDDTRMNLDDIQNSIKGLLADKPGYNIGRGLENQLDEALGKQGIKDFNAFRTAIINSVQALAGGVGSGLRINQAEISAAMDNDLPVITGIHADTVGSAQGKLDKLRNQLNNWEKILTKPTTTSGSEDYSQLKSQLKPGEILVKDKQSGGVGAIPESNYNSDKYDKIDFNSAGNASDSQVKGMSEKIPLMKPISFDAKGYTSIQKQNLAFAPDINIPKVTIGSGAAVKNNNPGNLRNTDGSWQHFASPQEGFKALMGYLERAKTGNHTAYSPSQSLYQFFSHYAPAADSNDPKSYAESVASKLGVSPNTKISQLDTFAWAKEIAKHESGTRVA